MHIGIAGNIGCGKTTLTRMLAEHYGWTPRFEAVTYNPYLEDYYKDIERWSYNLETYFLAQRFKDLLDISKCYLEKGDLFWVALDEQDRVIGCVGYNSIPGTADVMLHRLYVKASLKRQGIGSALLKTAEEHVRGLGKTAIHVHLGGKEYFESYSFYPKHGYALYAPRYMKKELM